MHELSIAQEIIDIVEQSASGKIESVTSVRVKLGKLSNVLADSLRFCFEALVSSTPMKNAKLEILEIPITVLCNKCGVTSEINGFEYFCANCSSSDIKVETGNEMHIAAIELSD